MMTNTKYAWLLVGAAVLCATNAALFGAVFVVTNTNNQGPGSLRQAIEQVNTIGGATNEIILSLVDGKITIFLLSELPTITKQVVLNGFDQVSQQPVVIEGGNLVTTGLHVSGSNASNTHITNLTIQNVQNTMANGPAYGILFDNAAQGCSVSNCTLQYISSGPGFSAEAVGIHTNAVTHTGALTGNTINTVISADNGGGDTGPAFGINATVDIGSNATPADCSHNTISTIHSGNSSQLSGSARAINVNVHLNGNCIGNTMVDVVSGTGTPGASGSATGILVSGNLNGSCSDNTALEIHSGNSHLLSGSAFGITVMNELNGNCNGNHISGVTSGSSDLEESGTVRGINIENNLGGTCTKNSITHLTSGSALNGSSGNVDAIRVDGQIGITAHNTIQQLQSGMAHIHSGEIKGIDLQNGTGRCSYNSIDTLTSGNAMQESGDVEGIELDGIFTGDCTDNIIKNLHSGNGVQVGNVFGIQAEDDFFGRCLNNIIGNFILGNPISGVAACSSAPQGEAVGIRFDGETTPTIIACNQIFAIYGGPSTGLMFFGGVGSIVQHNDIQDIHATGPNNTASGITLTNSIGFLITYNTISNITSEEGDGFGINVTGTSLDNEMLTNSIFNLDTKTLNLINNGVPTDVVQLALTSVRCGVGNRIIVSGTLIPQPSLATRVFLIQFFVSDSDTPEQTQTFIGDYEHDASSDPTFMARFVVQAPTQFGQFITATATALPASSAGSSSENLNTSEVSNALFACETQGGVCTVATCPTEPAPIPPKPCPVLSNCPDIDIL